MTTLPLDPYIAVAGEFHNPNSPGDNAYAEPPLMRSFASAIRDEINVSVVPPDLSNFYTKAESDARFQPIGAYITFADGDTRYEQLSSRGQPNGYAPLDANSLVPTAHIPPLAVTDTFVAASEAEMLALTAQRGDMAIRTDTGRTYVLAAEPASTLANWKEVLAAGQVTSVNGQTGVVSLTATDVGAYTKAESDAKYALIGHNHDASYLPIGTSIPPATHITSANGSVIVVESPTGTFDLAAVGGGGGNGPFVDPIVREKILWGALPNGAVDTWLWRAAAGVLSVTQPGADGATANGAQFNMMARSGPSGTTGASSLVWGVDTSIRWLWQMTPNNGPLILYDYGADGGTFQERFRTNHGGAFRFTGTIAGGATPAFPGWIAVTNQGSTSHAWFGQAVPGNATAARADLSAGAYYSGTAWVLQEAGSPGGIVTMMPSPNINSCLFGIWDFPDQTTSLVERLQLTRSGHLGLGETNSIGTLSVHPSNRIIKFGGTGVVEASAGRTFVSISDNYYFSASAVGFTITNNPSSYLQQADGVLTFANAVATAPGVAVPQRGRFQIDMNGTASFFSDGAQVSVDARNQMRVRAGASGLAGIWFMSADNVDRVFLGLDAGSTNSWRMYTPAIGNVITTTLNDGYVSFARGVGISGNTTITGTLTGNGSVFSIASTANIQFAPAGTIVHPSGHNTIHMGWVGLNWATVYAVSLKSDGQMNINPGFHCIISPQNGGWIYNRSTGHTFFDGSQGAIVAPEVDNKLICGGTGNRWQYVAAVSGSINTCYAHEKEIVSQIDPDDALDAVLNSPMFLFHPKDKDGIIDKSMMFAGPVNTSVDSRLRIGKGALTAAGHQAAYALASVQSLSAKLEAALSRIAELEAKFNGR